MKYRLATFGLAVVMFSVSGEALAQLKSYDLTHKLNPNLGANQVYKGRWGWFDRAHAQDKTGAKTDQTGYAEAAFLPPSNDLRNGLAILPDAAAYAESRYTAAANGAIEHHIEGWASVTRPNGISASARSYSRIGWKVGTKNAKGKVKWEAKWHYDTLSDGRAVDPLWVHALDLDTGQMRDELLWDLDIDVPGVASGSFENGAFRFSADVGKVHWLIGGLVPSLFDMEAAANKVVSVSATGIFAGKAPSVGDPATFGMDLGTSEFDIDYDLGNDNANGYETEFTFDALGQAAVPEPSALIALGVGLLGLLKVRSR